MWWRSLRTHPGAPAPLGRDAIRPPRSVLLFLIVGLAAASQSGNLVRLGEAPAVVIAAWRLALASLVLAPFAIRHRGAALLISRGEWALIGLAGVVLALHFWTWIAAIQRTTVANATSLLAVAPVLAAVGGRLLFRERLTPRFVGSLVAGVAGVVVIGAGDVGFGAGHLEGDALAVACASLFAVYLLLGRRLRGRLPNTLYVGAIYGVAAVVSFASLTALDLPVVDYSARTWLCFGLMALVPTLVGHTALNASLRYLEAGRVAVATLSEPPLAAVVALLAWGEAVTPWGAAGFGLIAVSVLLLVLDPAPPPARSSG